MQQEPVQQQHTNSETKSPVVAGVLGVFLGGFGAHDWYLGKTKEAITHVCLFVGGVIMLMIGLILTSLFKDIPVLFALFVCILIAAFVIIVGNFIWGFIEGVIIIAQGDAGLIAKGYKVAQPATAAIQLGTQTTVSGNTAEVVNTAAGSGAVTGGDAAATATETPGGGTVNPVTGEVTGASTDGMTVFPTPAANDASVASAGGTAVSTNGASAVPVDGAPAAPATNNVLTAPEATRPQGAEASAVASVAAPVENAVTAQDEAEAMAIINQAASQKNGDNAEAVAGVKVADASVPVKTDGVGVVEKGAVADSDGKAEQPKAEATPVQTAKTEAMPVQTVQAETTQSEK